MIKASKYYKIRISVPVKDAGKIREAINQAGGARQGNYDYATGSYRATGRFRPLTGANPRIGQVGQIEQIEEEIIEALCHQDKLEQVINAVKQAHPYEEPAIDILKRYEI